MWGENLALETSDLQVGAGWPYPPARGLVARATCVTQAGPGSTRSPELKSPNACAWGRRSTGRGADDRVWMVAPPEQLVAAGVGAGPFAVNPASLLGWHHTLHEFSHEFRPIALWGQTAPSLWEVVASGTVGPKLASETVSLIAFQFSEPLYTDSKCCFST